LAVPYLRDSFNRVIVGTVLGAIVIAVCGRFSDGVGLDTITPRWMVVGQTVVFLLVAATQFLYMVSLSHAAMLRHAELLRSSRTRVVAAADAERRRIERDLHDGAQQRLVATAIQARVAQRQLATTAAAPASVLAVLSEELQATAADLQNLCRGIYPAELTENGLAAALQSLSARSPVPTAVTTGDDGRRLPADVEVTVYFCCVESLQNSIKHAGAGVTVTITVEESPEMVDFTVADDGRGADVHVLMTGRGFTGMTDRLTAIGGTLRARSAPGDGVAIEGRVPLARTAVL
jgi:signal transduction histidine kinase